MTYVCSADFLPFRFWIITAESESEARLLLAKRLSLPYDETSATLRRK
jgi:hypothetical protein